jgi:hypothetical protein
MKPATQAGLVVWLRCLFGHSWRRTYSWGPFDYFECYRPGCKARRIE